MKHETVKPKQNHHGTRRLAALVLTVAAVGVPTAYAKGVIDGNREAAQAAASNAESARAVKDRHVAKQLEWTAAQANANADYVTEPFTGVGRRAEDVVEAGMDAVDSYGAIALYGVGAAATGVVLYRRRIQAEPVWSAAAVELAVEQGGEHVARDQARAL